MNRKFIAVDTEFMTSNTYHPKLALIQIAISCEDVVIIDALAIKDLSSLSSLMSDTGIVKVMHAPQMDLQLLHKATGKIPANIYDIQHAVGFINPALPLSLKNLVLQHTGVSLSSSATRSEWTNRPLTQDQLVYAADDVRFLCSAYPIVLTLVFEAGRSEWMYEDMHRYHDPDRYVKTDPEEAYLKIKVRPSMGGLERAVLQKLAAWRQRTAESNDLPIQWVLSNKAMVKVANTLPKTFMQLNAIPGVQRIPRPQKKEILDNVYDARRLSRKDYPPEPWNPKGESMLRWYGNRVKRVRKLLTEKAEQEGIAIWLLKNNSDIHALCQDKNSKLMQGWRYDLVGRDITMLFKEL